MIILNPFITIVPTNVSPEYKRAELAFRQASDPKERLEGLREMLRTVPKHKGTEHLQADIKSRIKQLSEEAHDTKKGGARSGPAQVVHPEGVAQVALLGPPNSGKSELHARTTGSHADVGPYPFTTHELLPGMLPYEDVHFQLIDLPPVTREHPITWIGNALQSADGCLMVVDLQDPECVEGVIAIRELLAERRVTLSEHWDRGIGEDLEPDVVVDPFAKTLPTLLIAAKVDLMDDRTEELAALHELLGTCFPTIETSVKTGEGLDAIGRWLFEKLEVVRVYTKAPGRPPGKDKPFTVRVGDTVYDVALQVYRNLADSLKFARRWGASGQFEGQQGSRDHPVLDGDVLELHG